MKRFHGIIPPVVTPLNRDGRLDAAGLERLLAHIMGGGVHGLFILGTTGEGPSLPADVQEQMIRETVRLAGGRLPVLVGISSPAFQDSLRLARLAADCGCDACVAAPPCYFQPGNDELIDFYASLAAAVSLPLFIYNMPSMTKVYMQPDLVVRLAEIRGVCGYKDSSANMLDFHKVLLALKDRQDFSIFIGPEELLGDAVLFGADGGIAGGANLNPRIFTGMYEAALKGDVAQMRHFQEQIYAQRSLYGIGRYQSSMIKGLKSALRQKGLCEDYLAAPFNHFEDTEAARVAEVLKAL